MTDLAGDDRLDDVFHALANRTRRALLHSLAAGPARVGELAKPHGMSVNAISKHLFVLQQAGLIRRAKTGHVQSCLLDAGPLASADHWLAAYRGFWDRQIDRLAEFVEAAECGEAAESVEAPEFGGEAADGAEATECVEAAELGSDAAKCVEAAGDRPCSRPR